MFLLSDAGIIICYNYLIKYAFVSIFGSRSCSLGLRINPTKNGTDTPAFS